MSSSPFSSGIGSGILIGGSVMACLFWAILRTPGLDPTPVADPNATVKAIGLALMSHYVLPLEVIALLLTAAMVGAIVIAMNESKLTETKRMPASPAKGRE